MKRIFLAMLCAVFAMTMVPQTQAYAQTNRKDKGEQPARMDQRQRELVADIIAYCLEPNSKRQCETSYSRWQTLYSGTADSELNTAVMVFTTWADNYHAMSDDRSFEKMRSARAKLEGILNTRK